MDREAWWAYSPWGGKELKATESLNSNNNSQVLVIRSRTSLCIQFLPSCPVVFRIPWTEELGSFKR